MFSWRSRKKEIVAQSTVETEFIAVTTAINQALWLRKIIVDLNLEQNKALRYWLITNLLFQSLIIQFFVEKLSISTSSYSLFEKFKRVVM